MENGRNMTTTTLSIEVTTNSLLEEIQHHLRRTGSRHYKARIMREALEYFAKGLGLEVKRAAWCCDGDQPVEEREGQLLSSLCPQGGRYERREPGGEVAAH